MKKQRGCYIYTRVSTSIQVDGYSLDAQKEKLHKYADYQDMFIAGEYSDEGKSGKSVEGRPQFQQMLSDIESGKENVDYVLVFKLSRFGRRKNEKIPGTRNEYHVVNAKTHSLDHEYILSGIIKCPVCGSGMYGNVNRKKHPDGGYYRDYFYYACKHRTFVNGHKCDYRKQWNEDKINAAVEEVIRKLVNNERFKKEIQKHIGSSIDTEELDREYTGLQERLNQVTGAKNKLASQMDNLSVSDKHYDKKYEDMQIRLDKLYDEIEKIETAIEAVETRLYNIKQEKISEENVYQFLLFFDKLYDRFKDMEKKTFMKSFLEEVNIYEAEQEDGRILKRLKFRFPVFFNNQELYELD